MHEHVQPACRAELADTTDADWNAAESFLLYEFARVLGSSPDHASLIGSITDGVCALLACEVALVHLNQAGKPVLQGWPELARVPSLPQRLPQLEVACIAPALCHAEPQQTVLGSPAAGGHTCEQPAVPAISALCVPVFSRGQVIGTLTAVAAGPRVFSRREIERLAHVATLSAFCLHSAWLAEEHQRQVAHLETLLRLDEALNAAATPDEVAAAVCAAVHRLFPASSGVLALFKDKTPGSPGPGRATLHTWGDGRGADCLRGQTRPDRRAPATQPHSATCWSLRRGMRVSVTDAAREICCPLAPATDLWQAYVCVPVLAPGITGPSIMGVLSIKFPAPMSLPAAERDLAYYAAERTAMALAHLQLLAETRAQGRAEGAVRAARAVAHEFGQPLSLLAGYAELLAAHGRELPPDAQEAVRSISEAVDRLAELVQQFRQVADYAERSPGPGLEMLDLHRVQHPLKQ
jgi:GAF domain-containing protein